MIIYVESNFILEIALGQKQSKSAEKILNYSEKKSIQIDYPIFSISEPFSTITVRGSIRNKIANSLTRELTQLKRSIPHKPIVSSLEKVPAILVDIKKKEMDSLENIVGRILKAGRHIELNSRIFKNAIKYESTYGLSPQDSIIYASVITDLLKRPPKDKKYFVSRNWKDFRKTNEELKRYNCQYIESYDHVLDLIRK